MATPDDIERQLAGIDLFDGVNSKTLHRIRESGAVQEFDAAEVVTAEGASVSGWKVFSREGVFFHVILSGSAEVRKAGETVATIGPGAYFGELSLIDGKPRSADVIAGSQGMTTFALPEYAFKDLLQKHPEIALPILQVLAARLRRADA